MKNYFEKEAKFKVVTIILYFSSLITLLELSQEHCNVLQEKYVDAVKDPRCPTTKEPTQSLLS